MCGFYFSDFSQSGQRILEISDAIGHRGPDYTGVVNKATMCAIHSRLSIVDLSAGSNQPFEFDDLILVYNGELYNAEELRNSLEGQYTFSTHGDTEVLMYAFHKFGNEVLKYLDGMFSFIIYNKSNGAVFGARDRLGQKPFYYSVEKKGIQVSSVISAIDLGDTILNTESLEYYLAAGHVHAPHTIIKNVLKLKPGHSISFKSGETAEPIITRYWDITYKSDSADTRSLIENSVQKRCISDVKSGCFLSGGLDSTVVSYFASKKGLKDTITVSIADSSFNEYKFAEKYAKSLGIRSKEVELPLSKLEWILDDFLEAFDEPFADNSSLAMMVLCKAASEEFKMCLSGDGADELYYGYNHHKYLALIAPIFLIPLKIRKVISSVLGDSIYANIIRLKNIEHFIIGIFVGFEPEYQKIRESIREEYSTCFTHANSRRHALGLFNAAYWLESNGNVKVDRSSMFYGLEVRSPFMDYRLYEAANCMPDRKKRLFGKTKRPIRAIFNQLIKKSIRMRGKKGFDIPIQRIVKSITLERAERSVRENLYQYLERHQKSLFEGKLKTALNSNKSAQIIWKYYVASRWIQRNI